MTSPLEPERPPEPPLHAAESHLPFPAELKAALAAEATLGIIVVDHGSRREESNRLLEEVAWQLKLATGVAIVEPAHMELAEPSLEQAFDRCVAAGARLVVVHPYFLGPGRHWDQDIPALAAAAAARHPGVPYLVTAPLGLHPLMLQIMAQRISHCLNHARSGGADCPWCRGTDRCQLRTT